MKYMVYALRDVLRNSFNPHGRLSRAGYWWAWLAIFVINVILDIVKNTLYGAGILHMYRFVARGSLLWKIAVFFPMLFAAVRRYHDCGKPGWLAVLIDVSGGICAVSGFVVGMITVLFFVFSAGVSVNMAGFLGLMAFSVLFLLAGITLCILNIVFLARPSDPRENVYGKPEPFYHIARGEEDFEED